jgi:hypothetical protein
MISPILACKTDHHCTGDVTKRSNERKTRRTPSVNARNMLELIMIKSFARLGNGMRKPASGAKASTLGQRRGHMPFQLRAVALDIPLAHMRVEVAIPLPRGGILTLIVNLASWIWVEIENMGGDVHENIVVAKLAVKDPAVADLMPITPMERQPGRTTVV